MGWLRVGYRLPAIILVQLWSLMVGAVLYLLFFWNRSAHRKWVLQFTQYWGALCCRVLNIRFQVVGSPTLDPRTLIVSNHIGTPDIFILAACFKTFFVSRFDVQRWPLLGPMSRLGATIFIDRAKRQAVRQMVLNIKERMMGGFSVALFPEGGATDGSTVRRFKSSAFEAVVQAGGSVQPVFIHYHDGNRPSIACWNHISFTTHILNLLKQNRLEVTVTLLPQIKGTDRHQLAEESHQYIYDAYMRMNR